MSTHYNRIDDHLTIGEHVNRTAQRMIAAAPSKCTFNGIELVADTGTTVGDIEADYNRQFDERAEAWAASSEGQAAAERAQWQRVERQALMNELMTELRTLDVRDVAKALDWMVRAQDPLDSSAVADRALILSTYEAAGYSANDNIGPAFVESDRENFARYIIGQAMDGIACVGAPHPVVHGFVERWRERFEPSYSKSTGP
jgi:hypothetical protein